MQCLAMQLPRVKHKAHKFEGVVKQRIAMNFESLLGNVVKQGFFLHNTALV